MAELIKMQYVTMPASVVVGKSITVSMSEMANNPIPAFWGRCFEQGLFAPLEAQADMVVEDSYVGWMRFLSQDSFEYVCGMLMKPGCQIPGGYLAIEKPETDVAIGWVQGKESDVYPAAHHLTEQGMINDGYKMNMQAGWSMELYNCPRFTTPNEQGLIILDYIIPVVKA